MSSVHVICIGAYQLWRRVGGCIQSPLTVVEYMQFVKGLLQIMYHMILYGPSHSTMKVVDINKLEIAFMSYGI